MNVQAIYEHLLSKAPWVDRATTVDKIIIGDPELDVDACVVTWIPSSQNLMRAAKLGVKLVVTHEPTFWQHVQDHRDFDAEAQEKAAMIDELGITVLRIHDCWDAWPEVGIPWAWSKHLGLLDAASNVTASENGMYLRNDIPPMTLRELAGRVAAACAPFGEPIVQLTGDPDMVVSKIGSGTGCACEISEYHKLGCDAGIVCDDGSCYWGPIQKAEDTGFGVIRVNHGTSEEAGMMTLANYITEALGVEATYLPTGCVFQLVDAGGNLL